MGVRYLNWCRILIILSGIGLIVGTILPWDVFSAIPYDSMETFYKPGYLSGGVLVEILGLILLLISFLYTGKSNRLLSVLVSIPASLSGVINLHQRITVPPSAINAYPNSSITIGVGYYVVLIAAALGIIGGISIYRQKTQALGLNIRLWLTAILLAIYVIANFSAGISYSAFFHPLDSYRRVAAIAKSELPAFATNEKIIGMLVKQSDLIWIGFPIRMHWGRIQNYQCFDSECNGIDVSNNSSEYFCWVLEDMGIYYQLRGDFTLC